MQLILTQEEAEMNDPYTLVVDGKLVGYFTTRERAKVKALGMLAQGHTCATIHDEVNFTKEDITLGETK